MSPSRRRVPTPMCSNMLKNTTNQTLKVNAKGSTCITISPRKSPSWPVRSHKSFHVAVANVRISKPMGQCHHVPSTPLPVNQGQTSKICQVQCTRNTFRPSVHHNKLFKSNSVVRYSLTLRSLSTDSKYRYWPSDDRLDPYKSPHPTSSTITRQVDFVLP